MNKSETKEVALIAKYHAAGLGADYVARVLSSLIRAARTAKSAAALREYAVIWGVTNHPEFIA